ncbi:endonuclease [Ideonella paludis]|uniref:endonuclease n=1 Tax=Ideonella paludis TaxID=1233411 RepID=UPI003626B353
MPKAAVSSPAALPALPSTPLEDVSPIPTAPGVYFFHGEGRLPLYIGKSINLRARVQQHLRAPEEAHMMAQTRRVSWQRTAGEVGALLLESHLIKTQQPLFNVRLRRSKQLCAWHLPTALQPPELVNSRQFNFAATEGLYGLFASAHAAKQALRSRAEELGLCQVMLGLEQNLGRGCFARQLGRCHGACIGQESPEAHHQRLRAALAEWEVRHWPFDGAVGLVERDGDWVQTHVLDQWCYLGTLEGPRSAAPPKPCPHPPLTWTATAS